VVARSIINSHALRTRLPSGTYHTLALLDATTGKTRGVVIPLTGDAPPSSWKPFPLPAREGYYRQGRSLRRTMRLLFFVLLALAACTARNPGYGLGDFDLGFDQGVSDFSGLGGDGFGTGGGTIVPVSVTTRDTVDILFLVDNSPSMTPKQRALQAAFPTLASMLQTGAPGNFHIGVVTSDLGSGQVTLGVECHPGGDGAKLQGVGAAADTNCQAPVGANFIILDTGLNTNNLPAGQDVAATFTCMASVGASGCGFEHQLESVYKALHDPIAENAGFLRPDSLLVVVLLTDEDDCSADPNTDLFDPANTQYGALRSYRCSHYGVMCGSPPMLMPYADSGGPLPMCRGATAAVGGKLFDVQRYVDFFSKPATAGGVKADPNAVVMVGLVAPVTPVESLLVDPLTLAPCAGPPNGTTCDVMLQHSCANMSNSSITGDPPVRIAQVIDAVGQHEHASICDNDYAKALSDLGTLIAAARQGGCIAGMIDASAPDCRVMVNGVPISQCGTAGIPCWSVAAQTGCTYGNALKISGLAASAAVQASCAVK
jgi:hypothetical protein